MKKLLPVYCLLLLSVFACKVKEETKTAPEMSFHDKLEAQYDVLYENTLPFITSKKPLPRTIVDGKLQRIDSYDWTSGFYPGSMWKLYEITKNEKWKERALQYTEKLDSIQYYEGSHDVGFMIGCSYGNAIKFDETAAYKKVVVQTAKSLATRFNPKAGVILSWNPNEKWQFPVIVDNMMNLELLFRATQFSGDSIYAKIAVTHANTTMKNHYREDYSSIHVLDYDPNTGEVLQRVTHQGYADSSAWARGQSWGLYGYVVMYRETQDRSYLDHAMNIANFIINHPNLPEDKVPYWDYNAPLTENTYRDASAAAIAASALYELSLYADNRKSGQYREVADTMLASLANAPYLAEVGTNEGFLLKHSVGHLPGNSEIDVPINYADYYFLEALIRKETMVK